MTICYFSLLPIQILPKRFWTHVFCKPRLKPRKRPGLSRPTRISMTVAYSLPSSADSNVAACCFMVCVVLVAESEKFPTLWYAVGRRCLLAESDLCGAAPSGGDGCRCRRCNRSSGGKASACHGAPSVVPPPSP